MIAIQTKYVGPSATRGARIVAWANKNRVTVPYDHSSNNPHAIAALALCRKMQWGGKLIQGGTEKGEVFVFVEAPFFDAQPVEVINVNGHKFSSNHLAVNKEEVQHDHA